MGAGAGYSTELMARAVAPSGKVYGQNPPDLGERGKAAFEARAEDAGDEERRRAVRSRSTIRCRPTCSDLDLVTFFFFYHDTTYMAVDRAEMNRKLFAALKPGGVLVIADHSAKAGRRRLGRQDRCTASTRACCAARSRPPASSWSAEGDFLRHPEDTARLHHVNRPTGPVDEFVLKFQKPK